MGRGFAQKARLDVRGSPRLAPHAFARHLAFERQTLLPAFAAIAAACGLVFMMLAWSKGLVWPTVAVLPGVTLALFTYLGGPYRLLKVDNAVVSLAITAGLSAGLFLLAPHVTLSELSLCLCLCMVLTTLLGQGLSLSAVGLGVSQLILFGPTGILLLLSHETQNLFLIGIIIGTCASVMISRSGFQKLLLSYTERAHSALAAEQNALDERTQILKRFHPFSLTTDGAGTILSASEEVLHLLACDAETLNGQNFSKILNTEHQKTAAQILAVQRAIAKGAEFEFTDLALASEEMTDPVHLVGLPCKDGRILLIIHSARTDGQDDTDGDRDTPFIRLIGAVPWQAGPDHNITPEANDLEAVTPLLDQFCHPEPGDGEDRHRLAEAMQRHEDIDVVVGPAPDGTFMRLLGQPQFDADGVFAGYRGIVLPLPEEPLSAIA